MSKKERTLTIYFDSEDPVYNKLMEMNKFSRAEYIRTALREAVSKGMMMTVSADGINVIYTENSDSIVIGDKQHLAVTRANNKHVELVNNKTVDTKRNIVNHTETIKETIIDIEENTDPFSII